MLLAFFVTFISLNKKLEEIKEVYEPFFPSNNKELAVKKYHKTKFNLNHPRFHFQDKYNIRKLFKINYSYYPYTIITKSLSYEDNANFIYVKYNKIRIFLF